jgi:hypothetical protein
MITRRHDRKDDQKKEVLIWSSSFLGVDTKAYVLPLFLDTDLFTGLLVLFQATFTWLGISLWQRDLLTCSGQTLLGFSTAYVTVCFVTHRQRWLWLLDTRQVSLFLFWWFLGDWFFLGNWHLLLLLLLFGDGLLVLDFWFRDINNTLDWLLKDSRMSHLELFQHAFELTHLPFVIGQVIWWPSEPPFTYQHLWSDGDEPFPWVLWDSIHIPRQKPFFGLLLVET